MAPFPPTNPYAPPVAPPAPEPRTIVPRWFGRAVFAASFWWLFLGITVAGFSQTHGGEHPDFAASIGVLGLFAALAAWGVHGIGAVAWQFWAWRSIRPEFRKNGSPAAALLLFVPGVSLVWMFVLTRNLAAAVDAQKGRAERHIRGGTLACILQIVALLFPLALPVAAYAWLRFTDDVSAALTEAGDP